MESNREAKQDADNLQKLTGVYFNPPQIGHVFRNNRR